MLEFEVQPAPEFELVVDNESETVGAMGDAILVALRSRLSSGFGASSALAAPKSGGKALHRTGTLAASIVSEVALKRGVLVAIVKPTGNRPDSENAEGKVSRARAKTKLLRAEKIASLITQAMSGASIDRHWLRKKPTKDGQVYKVGSVRVRTANTNAALAGILSVAPKDKRGISGGRASYRVFVASSEYQRLATEAAKLIVKFSLRATGSSGVEE